MSAVRADPPKPVDVSGGPDGIEADLEALVALAGVLGGAGMDALGALLALHAVLLDPRIAVTSWLDPLGYAAFEMALGDALDGPGGLAWAAARCGALDVELRAATTAYRAADRVENDVHDVVLGLVRAGPAAGHAALALVGTGDGGAAGQTFVADDPEMADVLVTGMGLPALLPGTASEIPDGHGIALDRGREPGDTPPRRLADLMDHLARVNDDPESGSVAVRVLTMADGSRRAVVDITGTKSWTPLPNADATSLTTNLRSVAGASTAYEQGVLAAMRRAGVRRGDPVMLVGHSEGGLVAVTVARDAVRSGEFDVTHVVTAGSPIGLTAGQVPSRVQVLALENRRDVVPHLDGRPNPDRSNVTTVTGDRGDGTITGDHSVGEVYAPIAADTEASRNASVRDFLRGADGYFDAVDVQTHRFRVRRRY